MQKNFVCKYESESNLFQGSIFIQAKSISEAQDKFFDWLRLQPVYSHMWRISIKFEEIEEALI